MANVSAIKLPDNTIYDIKDNISGYVTTDENLKTTALSVGSSMYLIGGSSSESTGTKLTDSALQYTRYLNGRCWLSIGKASTEGILRLYNAKSGAVYTTLRPDADITTSNTIYLPSTGGTLALTSDIPTVPTNVSAFTNDAGYITSYTETDPIFSASAAAGITTANITSWDNKVSKSGDTMTGTLVVDSNNDTKKIEIINDKINFYDAGGDNYVTLKGHNGNYLENFIVSLPLHGGTLALTSDIPTKTSDLTNDSGFITSYTETDPVFTASAAHGISASDITNWNGKQAALVSGTNIKTINNTSLLGSGDISITEDDHKWAGVELGSTGSASSTDQYVPAKGSMGNTSGTATWLKATKTPDGYYIAKYDNGYLQSTDMTEAEVTSFVNGLNMTASKAADYIVEQGTEDMWTYRKWQSGIAECWGVKSETLTSYGTWNNMYAYNTTVTFPQNLFVEIPIITYSARVGSGHALTGTLTGGLTTTGASLYTCSSTNGSSTSQITYWYIQIIGRWK